MLSLEYANLGAASSSGTFHAYAATCASTALPVPEPGTWATPAAGLGLIGVMVRRRRQVD